LLLDRAELARLEGDDAGRESALSQAQRFFETLLGAPLRVGQSKRCSGGLP
jgi:hypothetical protein